jgi:hypothetical protein
VWEVSVDEVQRKTEETTRSERRQGGSGDGGGVRRACGGGVRWRRRSSGLGQVRMEREQFHILVCVS